MAYEMVMPYHLHMPSYFLETFTEYPYVGRSYDFTSRAKVLGQENYSTNRISVGFIWQMPVF